MNLRVLPHVRLLASGKLSPLSGYSIAIPCSRVAEAICYCPLLVVHHVTIASRPSGNGYDLVLMPIMDQCQSVYEGILYTDLRSTPTGLYMTMLSTQ